ncbi:MAG TPA: hypothetical protein VJ901_06220 [Thermoanaerobaculia bacterium]|nr:hypothetical protein [Thermoanaerobaculia bacterium]
MLLFAPSPLFSQSMDVITVAGSTAGGGYVDATGTSARFSAPRSVVADSAGNVFVSDHGNHVIRKITPAGQVSTFAGLAGSIGGEDGSGSAARFNFPGGLAIDANDNVYVADTNNHTIRKITPAGVVTTIAGTAGKSGSTDADGSAARFLFPEGVAVDQSGFVYVADTSNHTIRRIAGLNATVTTFAGLAGVSGSEDGTQGNSPSPKLRFPVDLAVDANGDLYVADTFNHTIRKVTRERVVTTVAGDPFTSGSNDGTGSAAHFSNPWGIEVSAAGDIWIADTSNNEIRRMTPAGVVTTAGGVPNTVGVRNGALSQARFTTPTGLAFDRSGNLYVADQDNMVVRKVSTTLDTTTLAGSSPQSGTDDGFVSFARFFLPQQLAFDRLGNTFLTDSSHTIRKIDNDGNVSTFAGSPKNQGKTDGTGSAARFFFPSGIAVDANNVVWVSDTENHTIRRITSDRNVTTVAGVAGVTGKADGLGAQAKFNEPWGLAFDDRGNLFIADASNHLIRVMDPGGVVTTFAGSGSPGAFDGSALSASFNFPLSVAVDSSRNIYVADWGNDTIRKITPTGIVSTLAGKAGFSGSADGTGSNARFDGPYSVAIAPDGALFVADENNHTVRRVTQAGVVTTVAGRPGSPGNVDGTGNAARLFTPQSVTTDSIGRVWISDTYNHALKIGTLTAPRIAFFRATPDVLSAAGSSTLSWSTSDATSVVITPNLGPDVGAVAASGTRVVNVTQTTQYTLVATGPGGSATATVTVYVGSVPARRRPSR